MVDDVCLDAEAPATAHITLADIFSLHVVVADKVFFFLTYSLERFTVNKGLSKLKTHACAV